MLDSGDSIAGNHQPSRNRRHRRTHGQSPQTQSLTADDKTRCDRRACEVDSVFTGAHRDLDGFALEVHPRRLISVRPVGHGERRPVGIAGFRHGQRGRTDDRFTRAAQIDVDSFDG